MKILGIFRGFPGLGRVVSGVNLLKELEKKGHEVYGYSYLQGLDVLKSYNIKFFLDEELLRTNIMEIGLNPISKVASELIKKIIDENVDLVIIDGEALLISTLSLVFPREKIVALLNPTDLFNASLPKSTILFYEKHYLAAKTAIIHSPYFEENILKEKENLTSDIHLINTIIRTDVLEVKKQIKKENIIGILGGGSANSSENFYQSTILIGKKIINIAKILSKENFLIFCNDLAVSKILKDYSSSLKNVKIIEKYAEPKELYSKAKLVMCRSGRNTVSEVLYLQIPSILFASKGDFRSKEQEKNIELVSQINPAKMKKANIDESVETIIEKIKALSQKEDAFIFNAGNQEALEILENILKKGKK